MLTRYLTTCVLDFSHNTFKIGIKSEKTPDQIFLKLRELIRSVISKLGENQEILVISSPDIMDCIHKMECMNSNMDFSYNVRNVPILTVLTISQTIS